MKIVKATYLISSPSFDLCPKLNLPEYAFIGRSNVGKSSIINALCQQKNLAKTSGTPGKTQLINHFEIISNSVAKGKQDKWYIVDLPGYGFAKSSFHKRKDWAPLLEEYFAKRQALKAVVIFMDIRHPLKDSDRDMIELCNKSDTAFIPVLTKSDKLSNNQKHKAISAVNRQMQGVEAIAVSSKDIVGFDKLSRAILEFTGAPISTSGM